LATVAEQRKKPQAVIEKIVQKYAVGLPAGKQVKAGEYVMIRPEHGMTHDNTGPVISKFVVPLPHIRSVQLAYLMVF
jgi:homoaconitate hydratase